VYEKYIQMLGYEGVSYTFVPSFSHGAGLDKPLTFNTSRYFPENYKDRFVYRQFKHNDSMQSEIQGQDMSPMDWKTCWECDGLTKEDYIRANLKDGHGIKNGISLPAADYDKGIAGVCVISKANDTEFEILKKETLKTLSLCTSTFHDLTIHQPSSELMNTLIIPVIGDLKSKEIIILRFLASGEHLKNIQESTGISYSVANNHLKDLRDRLGGITQNKLMYLVGKLNILDYL